MDLILSTGQYRQKDRFEAWREDFCKRLVGLDIRCPDQKLFEAKVRVIPLSQICLTVGQINETINLLRTKKLMTDGNDHLTLMILKHGKNMMIDQVGKTGVAQRGGALIVDNGRSGSLTVSRSDQKNLPNGSPIHNSCIYSLAFNRNFASQFADPGLLTAREFHQDSRIYPLLVGYIESFLSSFSLKDPQSLKVVENHLVDLLMLMLKPNPKKSELAQSLGLRAARANEIMQAVNRDYSTSDISGKKIAEQMGISQRYLQILMEESGETFSRYLLKIRLEKVRSMLQNPELGNASISDIAFLCGFNDLSAFNRAFKRKYGLTPRDLRG